MKKLSHEKMMQKAWELIEVLGITEDHEMSNGIPGEMYIVDDIHQVRDAFYADMENGVEIDEDDLPGFFARHGIAYQ